ncbi:MAG: hypothetical protein IKK49_00595 [Clostridia bacterium]|nr:hypothetical protein [Clostridia bacterium]MBQ7101001.1 hypothetical protein [Clostridia bacterium]MBR3753586.1 hypothetical protein [Clostridia bacterium]
MNRGIIALVIIAAIGLLSVLAGNEVIDRAAALKEAALYACEDEKFIGPLKDSWEQNKDFFSLFVSHVHLEPIDQRINSIDYVSRDEIEESCAEIIAFADEIGELVKPSLYNVF